MILTFALSCKKEKVPTTIEKLSGTWHGYSEDLPGNYPGIPAFLINDSVKMVVKSDYSMVLSDMNDVEKYDGGITVFPETDSVFALEIYMKFSIFYYGSFVNNNYKSADGILGGSDLQRSVRIAFKKVK